MYSLKPTLDEFLQWPEQKPPLELIYGEVREKAMPDFPHGELQVEFSSRLWLWSKSHPGHTMTEQRCVLRADDRDHIALPDVAWWSKAQLPHPEVGPQHLAPFLVVEILSPSDRFADVQEKVLIYLEGGVAIVWVVDAPARKVTVHRSDALPTVVAAPRPLDDPALPGLVIDLSEVFAICDPPPRIQE